MKYYQVICKLLPIFIVLSSLAETFAAPVQSPQLLQQIERTGTSWFSSPIIHNLGEGEKKLIGTYYDVIVWDQDFNEIARARHGTSYPHKGRIYPPAICADLDNDGIWEIVVASIKGSIAAYEWKNNNLAIKNGWPASGSDAGQYPEVRGIAAGDLDNDGTLEVVATTTQTNGGAQVFVFNADGSSYQPAGITGYTCWPRYNSASGPGNDSDVNGQGNSGYGCFGLNVGLGNLDDDDELEIVVTFDNHQLNVFHHDGVSMLTSDYFTNRASAHRGNRLNWGQFIRWFDADVERDHYNLHIGDWPHPSNKKWLQWTQSPPSVADINGDGKNEVIAVANVEKDVPYDTKHHSIMVLEGSYGDGARSGRRLAGWEELPSSNYPQQRGNRSWYPPTNPPSPTIIDINNDQIPEILYTAHDGYLYCVGADGRQLWKKNLRHGPKLMYSSETMVADLNQDDIPELILTTYGDPENRSPKKDHGYLIILDNLGNTLHDIVLPEQGTNGNGKGAPAAPTVMDFTGDSNLEIVIQTFGVGCFVYTVPGSADNLLLWPTGRGNYLRDGKPWLAPEGDINGSRKVDLTDVIVGLRALTGLQQTGLSVEGDISGDNKIGLPEILYCLRKVAEIE